VQNDLRPVNVSHAWDFILKERNVEQRHVRAARPDQDVSVLDMDISVRDSDVHVDWSCAV